MSEPNDLRVLRLTRGGYLIILALKSGAYWMSGVMALSAEAVECPNLSPAIGVLVVLMVIAAAPLVTLLRQQTRGAAAKAQLTELVTDELGLPAALPGTLSITWGWKLGDPLRAITVATIIAYNAMGLSRENLLFLRGRSRGANHLNSLELSHRKS